MGCCGANKVDQDKVVEFDPDFKGPIESKHRRCRDVLWLLVFLMFWAGMLVIASLGLREGEPLRVINGFDSYGNICGKNNRDPLINRTNSGLNMKDRDFLFFFDSTNDAAPKICVSKCPGQSGTAGDAEALGLCIRGGDPYVRDADEEGSNNVDSASGTEGCPTVFFTTSSVLHRCVPLANLAQAATADVIEDINAEGVVSDIVSDLNATWEEMLYLCLIACGISLLTIFLMGYFAYVVIWTIWALMIVVSIAFGAYLWLEYIAQRDDLNATPEDEQLESDKDNVEFFFYGSIVWTVLGVILIVILLVLRSRLRLLVALFKEAGRAIYRMPLLLLFPIWTFAMFVILVAYFVVVLLYIYTVAEAVENENGHVDYRRETNLFYAQWYHIFGFLWTANLLLAIQECTIAGSIAQYYFTRQKSKISLPISRSFYRSFRYHIGSLIFGSFIIAVVQFIRVILAYIQRKLRGKSNRVVKFILKCLQCVFWCFEKCIKFLNRNAYIEMAITGHSFCKSARMALWVILKNALRMAVINSIGDFLLFVGKLLITLGTGAIALYWFRTIDDVQYVAVPVIMVMVFAYIVASLFMAVYEMAVDTIFLCFCEDNAHNDGSAAKPLFATENLRRFMTQGKRKRMKVTEAAAKNDRQVVDSSQPVQAAFPNQTALDDF